MLMRSLCFGGMMNSYTLKYLKADFYRYFLGYKIFIYSFSITAILIFNIIKENTAERNILFNMWWSMYGMQVLLIMIICSITFSSSLKDDIRTVFIRQEILRGDRLSFSFARNISIFLSGLLTFFIGFITFILIQMIFLPWYDEGDSIYLSAGRTGALHNLVLSYNFLIYSILFAILIGMLMGIVCLISGIVLLYVENSLIVYTLPALVYYFVTEYLNDIFSNKMFNLNSIYSGTIRVYDSDIKSYIYAVLFSIAIIVISTIITNHRLKKLVYLKAF